MIGWLSDVLKAVNFRWTLLDILDTERQYPSLIDDVLGTEFWQRALVKEQVENEKPPAE
jgi:hypothetical protein